jgi:hypothetical protein
MPVYPGAFLDDLVCPEQHMRWNRQADLLGRRLRLMMNSNFVG